VSRWYEEGYEEGLRFECTKCGACCSGAPGAVWVDDQEIAELAAHLALDPPEFEQQYVRRLGGRRALFERFDGDCVFLDAHTRRCTVYAARPVQCRTWPFWEANVASPEAWEETRAACPGAGHGRLFTVDEIREKLTSRATRR
jgi:Fe-S-cluster containining protein